jgi:DNA mismatch repair protein MutH
MVAPALRAGPLVTVVAMIRPPSTEYDLCERVRQMAGRTLGSLAREYGAIVPEDLRRSKGWAGTLVEAALGGTAGSKAEPDFQRIGVELKTVPVDEDGRPREATYVCTAPLDAAAAVPWEESWVRGKLAAVLWLPIIGEADCPIGERRVGVGLLWRPTTADDQRLRADWEVLRERLATGDRHGLDSRVGEVLQVRPKAADGASTTWALDADGAWVRTTPLGFYLRPAFTGEILERRPRSF